ncbi:MAG: Methyltransf11 domain-containing protein [Nitrospira sp.]|nr:MAG: Methyltransf11 domain-containing protein [Nitrospira sp.]
MSQTGVEATDETVQRHASAERMMVDAPCLICGGAYHATFASAAEIAAQKKMLQSFHQQRRRQDAQADLKDRTTFSQDYSAEVVQCRRCGFLYRNPRPTLRAVTAQYEEDEYGNEHLEAEFEAQHAWAERKIAAFAHHCRFSSHGPVVVEVGSFVGGFLAAAQRRGWSILGVDPGKDVANFCQGRGLPVFHGTLNDATIATRSVDAVVIWNTFDQLVNPDTTLSAARRILRVDGHLVLRVPNGEMFHQGVRWLKAGGVRRRWAMVALAWNNLLSFPYLNGYSTSTLDQLVARQGFTRVSLEVDTLMTLSDQQTTPWGRWEERIVKSSCRILARNRTLFPSFHNMVSPWLDVYYALGRDARDLSPSACPVAADQGATAGQAINRNLFDESVRRHTRPTRGSSTDCAESRRSTC